MRVYIISSVMHAFWLVLTYDLLEDRRIDDVIIKTFFNSLLYKTNRSQVAVRLFSIDHRGRRNVVRTSVTHSAAPRVPLFCSYCILSSSVVYYWTDARQLGIYLLNRAQSWAKAVTPSAKLYYVRPFPGLLFSFFPIIESEISEQASRQVATEEPNKGF